jgi:hypothetical protein
MQVCVKLYLNMFKSKYNICFVCLASVQSPSYADTPQMTATNLPLSMDPVLCKCIDSSMSIKNLCLLSIKKNHNIVLIRSIKGTLQN